MSFLQVKWCIKYKDTSWLYLLNQTVYPRVREQSQLGTYHWSPVLQAWTELLHYIRITTFSFLVKSNLVKLETSRTLILPPMGNVACLLRYSILLLGGSLTCATFSFAVLVYTETHSSKDKKWTPVRRETFFNWHLLGSGTFSKPLFVEGESQLEHFLRLLKCKKIGQSACGL